MGIPISAPRSFFAGDTVKWLVSAPDYLPANGWSLDVNLTSAAGNHSVTSTNNGDDRHLITFPVAVTTAIAAGDYTLNIAATDGTERFTIQTGNITVRPNLQSAADGRSQVKKDLDALNAWITSGDLKVAEYQIAGRSMKYHDPITLEKLRSVRKKEYRAEQNADLMQAGRKPRRRLLTRMAG